MSRRRSSGRAAIAAGLILMLALTVVQATGFSDVWLFSWPRELVCAAAVLAAAWAAGRTLLRTAFRCEPPPPMRGFLAIALGSGLLILATFGLAVAGWLHSATLAALVIAVALPEGLRSVRRLREPPAGGPEEGAGSSSRRIVTIALCLPLAVAFLYASLPAVFYDALVYHIGLPNRYLVTGGFTGWTGNSIASYPQNAEMLNVILLSLGGERAIQLGAFLIAALCAFALRGFAATEFGPSGGDLSFLCLTSQWPFWFAACFGKSDLLGAFFLLMAGWIVVVRREEEGLRPLVMAGLLAGLAGGVKLSNVVPAIVVGGLALTGRPHGVARRVRRGIVVLLVALATAGPWLVKNMLERGNPVFPAFTSVLGGRGWTQDNAIRMARQTGIEMDRSLPAVAGRVARIGFDRSGYGSGGEMSPFFLPLLAGGIVLCRSRRSRLLLFAGASVLVVGVGFVSSYLRVHAIGWLLACLAAGAIWARWRHLLVRASLLLVFLLIFLLQLVDALRMTETVSAEGSRVIRGVVRPSEYRDAIVNYHPLARLIDESLPADARILMVAEARTAYIERRCDAPYVWDDSPVAAAALEESDTGHVIGRLADEGYTHVLLNAAELAVSEAYQSQLGIAGGGPERLDRFFRRLPLVATLNGCHLFALPADISARRQIHPSQVRCGEGRIRAGPADVRGSGRSFRVLPPDAGGLREGASPRGLGRRRDHDVEVTPTSGTPRKIRSRRAP